MGFAGQINSFADLDVYRRSFQVAVVVKKEIAPQLRLTREYDLADQLSWCTGAIPALIAEGHAKRNQPKHFQKYLDDAMGEANEAIVHLSLGAEVYPRLKPVCQELISEYQIVSKELFRLGQSWNKLRSGDSIPSH